MSEFFFELGLFSLKTLVLVICLFGGIIAILILSSRGKKSSQDIEIQDLSESLKDKAQQIKTEIYSEPELKALKNKTKLEAKKQKKQKKLKTADSRPGRLYVLDFNGDIKASQTECLRNQITSIISVAEPGKDEVLVCIESPGGMVHGYGLAASQLLRLREKGLRVTVSVDKVAASGGYLMACTAHTIIAAPFAILGSIGVVAQVPNFNKLLKKHNVEYEEITAGEYKRTISVLGEITPEGRKHFEGKLEITHELFKSFVKELRPNLQLDTVANGDHWYGTEALSLGLIDKIQTSDEFILAQAQDRQVLRITTPVRKNLSQKLADAIQMSLENILQKMVYFRI